MNKRTANPPLAYVGANEVFRVNLIQEKSLGEVKFCLCKQFRTQTSIMLQRDLWKHLGITKSVYK